MMRAWLLLGFCLGMAGNASAQHPADQLADRAIDYPAELRELREQVRALQAEMAQIKADQLAARRQEAGSDVVSQAAAAAPPPELPAAGARLNVYGFLATHLLHDLRATAPGDSFTNLPEQPLGAARQGRTVLTAQASRVGLDALTASAWGPVHLKLETDFYAFCDNIADQSCPRNRLRIRQAYGEYGGLLVGQTWSTFVDLESWPDTIDFNGPNGLPVSRRPLIRYSAGDPVAGYKLALALESPVADGVSGLQGVQARMPNLVLRYDQAFGDGGISVRLLRHEKTDVASGLHKSGWGIGVGGRYALGARDVVSLQGTRLDGDADMLAGSNGYIVTPQAILFDKNYGLLLGWQHIASPALQGYLVAGANWSAASDAFISAAGAATANQRLLQFESGLIVSPVRGVEFGAEYVFGKRRTFNAQLGIMSRVELMAKYVF